MTFRHHDGAQVQWDPDLGDAVLFPSVERLGLRYPGHVTARWHTRAGQLVVRVIDEIGVERSFPASEITPTAGTRVQ